MKRFVTTIFLILMSSFIGIVFADHVYQEPQDFLRNVFNGEMPKARMLWITKARKIVIKEILGHNQHSLRIRYWQQKERVAWILEEIGKKELITVGIVIHQQQIERLKVLIFRENRGWEVRYPFFTEQFKGALLTDNYKLNKHIDGISGATLSVRALKKLAQLSLYLNQQIQKGK